MQKERDLLEQQSSATQAQTGLTEAQTATENQLRKLRKSLTHNQINEITQKIRASRVVTAEGVERLYAWLRGDREAGSLFGFIDKYVTGAGKDLLSSQYNNDIRAYLYDLMNGASEQFYAGFGRFGFCRLYLDSLQFGWKVFAFFKRFFEVV